MKKIIAGKESSGKSLMLAKIVTQLVMRNAKWLKKTEIMRPIYSNLKFSTDFTQWALDQGIEIRYWNRLEQLTNLDNCDVIIDEVGSYFDSRLWADLSLDVRRWLSQCAKIGIHIYGSAQDFAQVDKSFRRLTNELIEISKLMGSPRPMATAPEVKRIWGICAVRQLNPNAYNEDKKKFDSSAAIPTLFFIQKKYCEIFDTTQKIEKALLPSLRHEVRYCEHHPIMGGDGTCTHCKILHN